MGTAITPRPGISGALFDTVERWTHLGLGLGSLVSDFTNSTYESVAIEQVPPTAAKGKRRRPAKPRYTRGVPRPQFDGIVGLAPGALLNIALTTQSRSFDAISAAESKLQEPVARVSKAPIVAALLDRLREFLAEQNHQFQLSQQERTELATDFIARYGPKTMDELLSRIDIDSFVGRVDVDRVVDKMDLEAMIEKVPVDQVIDKIDLRAVVLDTVGQVQVSDILRESTSSTVRGLRDQVSNRKIPFRSN